MEMSIAYQRPRYTDYEISYMLNKKISNDKISLESLVETYGIDDDYLNIMLNGNSHMSYKMYKIASSILSIEYKELTAIDTDESEISCRQTESEDKSEFFDMVNYLFSELILQRKMAID